MHLSYLLQEASSRLESGLPEIEPHGAMSMKCRYNLNLADVLHDLMIMLNVYILYSTKPLLVQ